MRTQQINDFIDQIRVNPDKAAQMAEASNDVFNKSLRRGLNRWAYAISKE